MSEKINLNHITKIEGHADLSVEIKKGKLVKCNLGAVEGARFFEGIVVGRKYDEIKEITSRICGICSVSHSMTSLKATENAFGIEVSDQTKLLRELMSIGERIRSHTTHLYFLVLPDYLGYESAIEMAKKYQKEVGMALDLMKIGNEIVEATGGRQMHPVSSVVGGFTEVPSEEQCDYLLHNLKKNKKPALETLKLFLKLKYPTLERSDEYLSLKPAKNQPTLDGTIVSNKGFEIDEDHYYDFLKEKIEPYSNAKFAVKEGKSYVVGALSRINNNFEKVSDELKSLLRKHKIVFPSTNIFYHNVAQALELYYWLDQAIKILKNNKFQAEPLIAVNTTKSLGRAVTEAPRGLLFHEYEFDSKGYVTKCNIMTPTVQNLRSMEEYIKIYLQQLLDKKVSKEKMILEIEKLIRAYDPCFSCATHFLKVNWKEK